MIDLPSAIDRCLHVFRKKLKCLHSKHDSSNKTCSLKMTTAKLRHEFYFRTKTHIPICGFKAWIENTDNDKFT